MMKHPLTRALSASFLLFFVWAAPARAQNPLLELVTDAVPQPIYVTNAGGSDDRLFIVERGGRIRIVNEGVLLPTPFLDLADSPGVVVDSSGEGGLLSIAFHPDYSNSGNDPNNPPVHRVFVSYTAPGTGGNALTSVIARYDLSASDPNRLDPLSAKVLLTVDQPATNHNGGQIQFNRQNGFLYIGFGDGGGGGVMCPAQQPLEELGKFLRIDVDLAVDAAPWYEVPPGNPFYDPVDPNDPNNPGDGILDTIWSAGWRNPWRFSFDRSTGDLWIADVGEQAVEELDVEFAGASGGRNYGWSVKEGTRCVVSGNPTDVGCPIGTPRCNSSGYTEPIFEYEHPNGGAAITGGYVYRGAQASGFQGRYIFGDSSIGDIYVLAVSPNGLLFEREVLSSGDLTSPASFGEDSEGELYVADIATDRVYRLRLDLVPLSSDFKCISKMNAQSAKFGSTVEKELLKCVTNLSRGKIPPQTATQCVDENSNNAIAKGKVSLAKTDDKYCQDNTPPFGYAPYPTVTTATLLTGIALLDDVLGDLEVSVSTDKEIAKCQTSVLKGMDACQRARLSEFVRCKKQKIKDDTLLSADDIVLCISADPGGKVAKACAPAQSKLALKTIPKSCVEKGVDLEVAFPGCASADAALLAECIDVNGRCRACQMLSGVDALEIDCALECPAP